MVVDRKVAVINSNNIQDRPNLEMMAHLEGPIVDSFYETFLISWAKSLNPTPPCLSEPYVPPPEYLFQDANPYLDKIEIAKAAKAARILLLKQNKQTTEEFERFMKDQENSLLWNFANPSGGDRRRRSLPASPDSSARWNFWGFGETAGTSSADGKRRSLMEVVQEAIRAAPSGRGDGLNRASSLKEKNKTLEMAEVKRRKSHTDLDSEDDTAREPSASATAVSSMADIGEHKKQSGEEKHREPSPSGRPPPKRSHSDLPHLRIAESDIQGHEHTPSHPSHPNSTTLQSPSHARTGSTSTTKSRLQLLSEALNVGALSHPEVTATDEEIEDLRPHILHKPHKPFRIALVNRKPHGAPGHQDIRVPQAAAWLAGFRYAKENVFIQTPTLNAKPVVRAVLETCKRKVKVVLYLDLGFNDKGESVPFQGGTNEEVVGRLYKELRECDRHEYLDVYWYTGKDQRKPLNAVKKQRNCHVKFMTIDGKVGIMGNGNQDTQSWFHSCEINIMVDSPQIVADWMDAIRSNQNTEKYGKVDHDGIWRGENGDLLEPPEKVRQSYCENC
ncbi:hypothetical protein BT69DRAFT_510854 [Atractiella rhizophila]|nr:hypothetical protein BT69DRAFT_510854 [Atractiella rhizophila]